jgi:hypothetical protein
MLLRDQETALRRRVETRGDLRLSAEIGRALWRSDESAFVIYI